MLRQTVRKFVALPEVIYGSGSIESIGSASRRFGASALLVTGKSGFRRTANMDRVLQCLHDVDVRVVLFDRVEPEPSLDTVEAGLYLAREGNVQMVIGIGGGSVLDVAKAIAGLINESGSIYEIFEGAKISTVGIPFVAVPTTAGTGAEVTNNSVLTNTRTGVKQSIRDDSFMSRLVILDPELTLTLPKTVTAYSGMDALTQAIEAYTSANATELTDANSLEAVKLIGHNLLSACNNGQDVTAREKLLLGSYLAGVALVNARLGAVHGLAHPVGAKYGLAHGLVCAILLPYVINFNMEVAREKYRDIEGILCGREEDGEALVNYIFNLNTKLGIPKNLGKVGLKSTEIPELAESSLPSGSLKSNPRKASYDDLVCILQANLD
jgi:alcohol dehydrogenase class IV